MALTRWEPFDSFDNLLSRLPGAFGRWPAGAELKGDKRFEWSPSVDISETDKEFLIRAELPAVKKDDIHVSVDNGLLTISGERRQRDEEKNEKIHRIESFYGSFTRSFSLPDFVNAGEIKAESKDGILTIHAPKREPGGKKAVQVEVT